ncbi:MAG TPA: CoA transferase, partial [Tepidiformaceae bacterium]|nr:CoA transferase [Tepidiformaceae bacterium]
LAVRGNTASMLGKAFRLYYGGYVVKDGALILGALTPLNREQMRQAMGIAGEDPTAAPDFNAFDPANEPVVEAIAERIRSIMRSRTMDEWIERFDQVGAPASKVNFPEDMAEDPQVQAMEFMVALDHDITGPELMVGPIITMSATPTGNRRASPALGHDTDEVLAEGGFSPEEIAALRECGAAA